MNNINLIGNICFDIELKYSKSGKAVVKIVIAVRRDKEKSDFIPCVAFGKTAELIAEHFRKGHKIGITGSLWTGDYENDRGEKRKSYDVCINSIDFIQASREKVEEKKERLVEKAGVVNKEQEEIDQDFPFKVPILNTD